MEALGHTVILGLSAFIMYSAEPGSSLFSWHPFCMILAWALFTEGVLLYKKFPRSWRVNLHGLFQGSALTLMVVGFFAIYTNKEANERPHFVTYHGIMGLITLIFLSIQSLGGTMAKYSAQLRKMLPVKPTDLKRMHKYSGSVSISAIYVTVALAMFSLWFQSVMGEGISSWLWWPALLSIPIPYLSTILKAYFV